VASNEDWKLPASADACSRCRQPLLAGSQVTTVVRLLPLGPERQDLCASCGQNVEGDGSELFWRRTRPPDAGKKRVVDYTMLRELFGRMLERSDEIYRRLSYLVALVLIRKRHLKLSGFEVRGGREVMVVSRGAGQPTLDVPAPHLTPEDMVSVREHLTRLLNADLQDHDLPELSELAAGPEPAPERAPTSAPGDSAGAPES